MNTLELNKTILNIIKYGAIIPIIVFSIISTYILIEQKNIELEKEVSSLKEDFLKEKKNLVKNEIMRVISSLNFEIKNSEKKLKKFLKEKVNEAHGIATNIYLDESSHEKNGHTHSKEHIFRTIKYALGGMRYNKDYRGYIFIDDINGTKLLQPTNTKLEGKNLLEFEDAKGYKFVKKIVNTIKNKTEAYDTYYWYKSEDDPTPYKKLSFYKYFKPYNVAIGTGEYLIDAENELKEKFLKRINNIKFGDNRYIFAFDEKGTYLAHLKKEKLGTNGFKVQDEKGSFFIKDLVNFAKRNKGGYFSYTATSKPNDKIRSREKISFVVHFDKWNWTLGTGFYLEELNESIAKKELQLKQKYKEIINKIILLSFIITVVLLAISFYASKIVSDKFKMYKKQIKKETEKAMEKDKLLIHQSKLAIMGEMMANITHQWRQPLSAISTLATGSLLQKEMNLLDDKDFNKSMNIINDTSQYLSQTIEDFSNFFNPHKIEENIDIKTLFAKTDNLVCSRFKDHQIELINDIESFEVKVLVSELLQVLINILKNARDELIKKHIDEKKLIFVSSKKEEKQFVIKIKDNAGGIPIEVMNKIFDPYFTTKQNSNGTGIGLYMSKQIIEKMNGSLTVENEEYEYKNSIYTGAEFYISLPLK